MSTRKTGLLQVRIDEGMKERLRKRVELRGLKLTDWVIECAEKELQEEVVEPEKKTVSWPWEADG